jgi:cell division protein FtsB
MSDHPPVAPAERGAAAPREPGQRARRRLESVRELRDLRRRLWTWGLTVGLIILLVNAVVGENGYLATVRARGEKAVLASSVTRVRLENQQLQDDSRRLAQDPAALEEAARRSLGLMRPGETMVIIRDAAPAAHPPAPK